jgi:hypothetical protein
MGLRPSADSQDRPITPRQQTRPTEHHILTLAGFGEPKTVRQAILIVMDHLEVLREKIGRLRVEIAQIQELNEQYRLEYRNEADAQAAHGQRHERLQAIQQELAQLAALGRKVRSVEEMKEKHRSRLHLVKNAS